jgi:hypothetical protein
MSFADPQSITINAVAISLPRTSSGVNSGVFTSADGNTQLTVQHAYGKRTRRAIKQTSSKVAPDPLIAAQNVKYSASISLVVDAPPAGFTNTELKQQIDGFIAALSATSGAKISQLLGGEN